MVLCRRNPLGGRGLRPQRIVARRQRCARIASSSLLACDHRSLPRGSRDFCHGLLIMLKRFRYQIAVFFSVLGPGFITAVVDNDAGGIFTYSQAGARWGYLPLWTLIPITLLLIVTQEMCSRMGAVTGKGLSDLIRERFGEVQRDRGRGDLQYREAVAHDRSTQERVGTEVCLQERHPRYQGVRTALREHRLACRGGTDLSVADCQ